MAGKTVRYGDFESIVAVNRGVVLLTKEPHEYSRPDGEKLKEILAEIRERADGEKTEEAVKDKASFLVYKLASGQHFRSGNKRTALVAGLVFLRKNGFKIDITNPELVSAVDRVGVAAASLDDLFDVISKLVIKTTPERKSWESAIKQVIEDNREFLTDLGS